MAFQKSPGTVCPGSCGNLKVLTSTSCLSKARIIIPRAVIATCMPIKAMADCAPIWWRNSRCRLSISVSFARCKTIWYWNPHSQQLVIARGLEPFTRQRFKHSRWIHREVPLQRHGATKSPPSSKQRRQVPRLCPPVPDGNTAPLVLPPGVCSIQRYKVSRIR